MNAGLALPADNVSKDESLPVELRNPRPEAVHAYDVAVLICLMDEGESRARSANLPLPECRAASVREALQMIVEQARALINDCLARERSIPWLEPSVMPEDNESRFVVPVVF